MSSLARDGHTSSSSIVGGMSSLIEGSDDVVFLQMFSEFDTSSWCEHVSPHCGHCMSFALRILNFSLCRAQAMLLSMPGTFSTYTGAPSFSCLQPCGHAFTSSTP